MQFHRPILLHLFTFAAAILLCSAGDAEARRRGFTLITTGTTHSELGPISKGSVAGLAPEMKSEIQQRNYDTVGYQYSHFGIFWLDLWNWNGEYIVYNKVSEDGAVAPLAVAAALMGVEERKLPKPLNYRFPYGLMIICGLASLKVVPRLIAKRKSRQALPDFRPPTPSGGGDRPRWTPLAPQAPQPPQAPPQMPTSPLPSAGPPPVPPPLPPES